MSDPKDALPEMTTHTVVGRASVNGANPWEQKFGYSRAVRAGEHVTVTGTLGPEVDGSFDTDPKRQASRAFDIIEAALRRLGARLEDVVLVRGYIVGDDRFDAVLMAVGEVFAERFEDAPVHPCLTQVGVARLAGDGSVVELEAIAIGVDRRTT